MKKKRLLFSSREQVMNTDLKMDPQKIKCGDKILQGEPDVPDGLLPQMIWKDGNRS